MNDKRIILHADLNSFFAMAEQQANPMLREKPVGIVKAKGRTCIIAASVEAKKYGVATGCRVGDAKKLCPDIILVPADFAKYEDISRRFIKICADCSPFCEVFSLDECFIDVSETEKFWSKLPDNISAFHLAWVELAKAWGLALGAVNIALNIKRRLRQEIGDYMTCSIGISHNRILAKLASGQMKKDGLFWINKDNVESVLDKSNLMAVCGLGYRLNAHLTKLGIENFLTLRSCSLPFLHKHFGPYWSLHLFNLARGIDDSPVVPYTNLEQAKSVGRTYTTHKPLNSRQDVYRIARNLAEEAAFKARTMGLAGRYAGFYLRTSARHWSGPKDDENSKSWYGHRTLKNYISLGKELFEACKIISADWRFENIIFCGVTLGMLTRKDYQPASLFEETRRNMQLIEKVDAVNNKFGDYTIFPAQLLGMSIVMPEVTGYFGDKKFRLQNFLREN